MVVRKIVRILKTLQEMGCSQFLVPLGGNFVLFFVSCFVVRIVRGLALPPPTFPPCPPPQVFLGIRVAAFGWVS